jgi:hypothetical protein
MARIKIKDLPGDQKISQAEMKNVFGGLHVPDGLPTLDSMSEMDALQLQLAMDRRSQFISTLSNMMKKISTTQDTLTQNLK